MIKGLVRTTIRIDNNLKTRIELLAIKNNLSFNKMLTYLLDIGYNTYLEKFDKSGQEAVECSSANTEKDSTEPQKSQSAPADASQNECVDEAAKT